MLMLKKNKPQWNMERISRNNPIDKKQKQVYLSIFLLNLDLHEM